MGWVAAYLASVIFGAILVQFMSTTDGNFELEDTRDLATFWGCMIFWPIFVGVILPWMAISDHYKDKLKNKAYEIKSSGKVSSNKQDRGDIVTLTEEELKILLKAYRKQLVELTKEQVEIIREELAHRIVENQLLK